MTKFQFFKGQQNPIEDERGKVIGSPFSDFDFQALKR